MDWERMEVKLVHQHLAGVVVQRIHHAFPGMRELGPLAAPPGPLAGRQYLEERHPGGLGVHLVKHVAAHYCYSGSDASNTIELYFSLVG